MQVWGAELKLPSLRAPVMDEAGFLSESEEADLNRLAYEIYTNQGPQITIFTVNDMQGYPIEEFSIRVAEKWRLGSKEKDNGLLIIVAKTERQMRIEVGNGIEGEITDYDSNLYIRNILTPSFKQGQFYAGLRAVLEDVAVKFNIKIEGGQRYIRKASPGLQLSGPFRAALPFLIFGLVIAHIVFRRHPLLRGVVTGGGLSGTALLFLGGVNIASLIFIFFFGLIAGTIGLHNLLFALASGTRHSGPYRGGGYGGGFGRGGGGWGGGGGGFSGGGSSGSW